MKVLSEVFEQRGYDSLAASMMRAALQRGLRGQLAPAGTREGSAVAEQLNLIGTATMPSSRAQLRVSGSIASRTASQSGTASPVLDSIVGSGHFAQRYVGESVINRMSLPSGSAMFELADLVTTSSFFEEIAGATTRPTIAEDSRRVKSFSNVQKPEIVSRVTAIRDLMAREQISAARRLMETIPIDALNEPSIRRLGRALAPPTVRLSARRGTDRTQAYEWLRQHGHEHRGQWVAVGDSGLIASASTLNDLREQLRALAPAKEPLIHKL